MSHPVTIALATVGGAIAGQLSVGIPLAMRLGRRERPAAPVAADDAWLDDDELVAGFLLRADWPEDRAGQLLAAWRDRPDQVVLT